MSPPYCQCLASYLALSCLLPIFLHIRPLVLPLLVLPVLPVLPAGRRCPSPLTCWPWLWATWRAESWGPSAQCGASLKWLRQGLTSLQVGGWGAIEAVQSFDGPACSTPRPPPSAYAPRLLWPDLALALALAWPLSLCPPSPVPRRPSAETSKFLDAAESLAGPYQWGRYDLLLLPPSFPYGGCLPPVLCLSSRRHMQH